MSVARVIPVYARRRPVAFALVDEYDYERLAGFRWRLGPYGHAERALNGRNQAMHREIVGLLPGEGKVVHHINEDPLDNRWINLQVFANHSEHGRAPHPKKEARVRAAMRELIAANPGWPYHADSIHARRRAADAPLARDRA